MSHVKSIGMMALVSFLTIAVANRVSFLRSTLRTDA